MSCFMAIEGEETLFAKSWLSFGYLMKRAHIFVSAGYQAIVALTEMK